MPTCTVTTANTALSPEQKSRMASAITAAHNTYTGAPGYFAQVIFAEVPAGDHFIGGKRNTTPHVYIFGVIRACRTDETKRALMEQFLREAR
jgi:phenylpyruvate tautomerase PptA (4-oxalocrotonate tautomerase family)